MFCDTLTTPLVAQVVRRHKIIKARLTCTGAVAVWETATLSTCGGTLAITGRTMDADRWNLVLLVAASWPVFCVFVRQSGGV